MHRATIFGQKALLCASMLITANVCYSEHAPDCHFRRKDIGSQPIDFLQLRECALMPFYVIASMIGSDSSDWEHALNGQNWFINACAEQPKTVQKYSSNKQYWK